MDWPTDPFALLALCGVLVTVGWGFGLSAALARCSFARAIVASPRARLLGVVLAVFLALTTSYAYAIVLDATGFIDYCDPVHNAIFAC